MHDLSFPHRGRGVALAATAAATWAVFVLALAAADVFRPRTGLPPLNLLMAVMAPLAVFFGLYAWSRRFRAFVLAIDLWLLVMVQAWRVVGFVFLPLLAFGMLPGLFAWPAGVGDVAVGLAAPWFALKIAERPQAAATTPGLALRNWLGIFDLVVAVATGVASSVLGITGAGPTTATMSALPLVIIPALFVPLFIMAHIAALLQVRRLAAAARPAHAAA